MAVNGRTESNVLLPIYTLRNAFDELRVFKDYVH